jgi:hypothetical protein
LEPLSCWLLLSARRHHFTVRINEPIVFEYYRNDERKRIVIISMLLNKWHLIFSSKTTIVNYSPMSTFRSHYPLQFIAHRNICCRFPPLQTLVSASFLMFSNVSGRSHWAWIPIDSHQNGYRRKSFCFTLFFIIHCKSLWMFIFRL